MHRLDLLVPGALIVVALVAGCAAPSGSSPAPVPGSSAARPAAGMTDLGGGRAAAYGWLTEVDLEGGTWEVVSQPPTSSVAGGVVAVLVPGTVTTAQLGKARGVFVGAEGVLQEGVSIRMAGPEIVVDTLRTY